MEIHRRAGDYIVLVDAAADIDASLHVHRDQHSTVAIRLFNATGDV